MGQLFICEKGTIMISETTAYLLGGAVLGRVVPKILASEPAKRLYVQGIAAGMRAKASYNDLVEQARAEVGDMVAEAAYINTQAEAQEATD